MLTAQRPFNVEQKKTRTSQHSIIVLLVSICKQSIDFVVTGLN